MPNLPQQQANRSDDQPPQNRKEQFDGKQLGQEEKANGLKLDPTKGSHRVEVPETSKSVKSQESEGLALQQSQQLSYQTNRLSQYVELQLSDLENTLHYIQKKHSLNQIKECISHCYNIFSETEPIFRQLRINFIYDKIKKLVNCFSIIYLVLMDHIEKPSSFQNQVVGLTVDSVLAPKSSTQNQTELPAVDQQNAGIECTCHCFGEFCSKAKGAKKAQEAELKKKTEGIRARKMGGVHLFNEQYNRHIESDLDRLKKKLQKQQHFQQGDVQNNRTNLEVQKQRFKEQILQEINAPLAELYSPPPDQLTLFFNLNSSNNRLGGHDLQLITFQDELQEIAAFFKQSQDEALQFLNKPSNRDDFGFLISNCKESFKEAVESTKAQKKTLSNIFIQKIKVLFDSIRKRTQQRQQDLKQQIKELKMIQSQITPPQKIQIASQTSRNYEEEIYQMNKKYEELKANYESLKNFHQNGNADDELNLSLQQQKLSMQEREIGILVGELNEKEIFINFLNEKIQSGMDTSSLRKLSMVYRNHTKKHSTRIRVDLGLTSAPDGTLTLSTKPPDSAGLPENQNILKRSQSAFDANLSSLLEELNKYSSNLGKHRAHQERESFNEGSYRKSTLEVQNRKVDKQPITGKQKVEKQGSIKESVQKEQVAKKKRKQGMSFFAPSQKRMASFVDRKASFNYPSAQDNRNRFSRSEINYVDEESIEDSDQSLDQYDPNLQLERQDVDQKPRGGKKAKDRQSLKKSASKRQLHNVISTDKKQKKRISLQANQKSFNKNIVPKRSAFASKKEIEAASGFLNAQKGRGRGYSQIEEEFMDEDGTESQISTAKINYGQLNHGQYFREASNQSKANIGHKKDQFQEYSFEESEVDLDQVDEKHWNQELKSSQNRRHERNQSKNLFSQTIDEANFRSIGPKRKASKKYRGSISIKRQSLQESVSGIRNSKKEKLQPSSSSASQELIKSRAEKIKDRIQNHQFVKKNIDIKIQPQLELSYSSKPRLKNGSKVQKRVNQAQNKNSDSVSRKTVTSKVIHRSTLSKTEKPQNGTNSILPTENTKTVNRQGQRTNSQVKSSKNQNKHSVQISVEKALESECTNVKKSQQNESKEQIIEIQNLQTFHQIQNLTHLDDRKGQGKGNTQQLKNERANNGSSSAEIEESSSTKQWKIPQIQNRERQSVTMLNTISNNIPRQNLHFQSDKKESINRENGTNYERLFSTSSLYPSGKGAIVSSEKMEEILEKNAIKVAMKSKNIEQFKKKIQILHIGRCGENCRHLQRYLANFNKYKSNNRQMMKVHIENVNDTIDSRGNGSSCNFPAISGGSKTRGVWGGTSKDFLDSDARQKKYTMNSTTNSGFKSGKSTTPSNINLASYRLISEGKNSEAGFLANNAPLQTLKSQ